MEVGPFRTVPASQTTSGKAEVKLVDGGWEEFATIVFSELTLFAMLTRSRSASWYRSVICASERIRD